MKVFCFLLICCTTVIVVQAQEDFSLIFDKINTEVQASSKAYATLKNATDAIGHRLTGSDHKPFYYKEFKQVGEPGEARPIILHLIIILIKILLSWLMARS